MGNAISSIIDKNNGTITTAKLTATETSGAFNYFMATDSEKATNQYSFNNTLIDGDSSSIHADEKVYLPFDGNADDESGNGNDGVVTAAALTTDRFGTADSAYEFDSVSDVITMDGAKFPPLGNNLTISAWIYPTSITGRYTIFSPNNEVGGMQIEIGNAATGDTGKIAILVSGQWVAVTEADVLVADTWQHIVYTRSGTGSGTHTLYLNGVSQTLLIDAASNFTDGTNDRYIGQRSLYYQNFPGKIDEVRIYDKECTAAEVLAIYKDSTGAGNYGTLHVNASAYYPFNGNANDESDNSNNGTLSTATALHAMDATTGFTNVSAASFSLNTTTFQEGTGAVSVYTSATGETNLGFDIAITEQDLSNKIVNFYVYIKNQIVLDKITGSQIYLHSMLDKLGGADGWNVFTGDFSNFGIGWNVVSLDVSNPDSEESDGAVETAIDKMRIRISKLSATEFDDGDIILDYFNYGTPMKTRGRLGVDNTAYKFDNEDTNYKVRISSSADLWESGDLTFSTWFKPTNLTLGQYILCHYNWRFRIAADKLYFTVGRMNDIVGGIYDAYSIDTLNNDEWYHAVAVYHPDSIGGNGYIKLYLNGVLQQTVSIGSDIIYTAYGTQDLEWGNSNHGAAIPFEGSIDETMILDTAMNDNEVASLYEMTNRHDLNDVYVDGKLDKAVEVNGITYSQLDSAITMDHEKSSISFWAYVTDELKAGGNRVIGHLQSTTTNHIVLYMEGNTNKMFFMEPNTNAVDVTWPEPVAGVTNGWHHFAFTMDTGGAPKLYLDGVDQGTPTSTTKIVTDDFNLQYIGAMPASATYPYGEAVALKLDDLRIYQTTTLSQVDVTAIYNEGTGTEQSDAYFESVTSGTAHTFLTPGTDLRWKAEGVGEISQIKIENYH